MLIGIVIVMIMTTVVYYFKFADHFFLLQKVLYMSLHLIFRKYFSMDVKVGCRFCFNPPN